MLEWSKFAGFQPAVLWQVEHCPPKCPPGRLWQLWQSLAPAAWWLKLAGNQPAVAWQAEHCPPKCPPGRVWQDWQSTARTAW
jgi:hypothetical protein